MRTFILRGERAFDGRLEGQVNLSIDGGEVSPMLMEIDGELLAVR